MTTPRRRGRPTLPALATAAALLLLCTAPTPGTPLTLPFLPKRTTPASALIDWVRAGGGNVSVTVGPIPGRGGLRGMMAGRAVAPGEALVVLPSALSVPMGTAEYTTPVRGERERWGGAGEVSPSFTFDLLLEHPPAALSPRIEEREHGAPPTPRAARPCVAPRPMCGAHDDTGN